MTVLDIKPATAAGTTLFHWAKLCCVLIQGKDGFTRHDLFASGKAAVNTMWRVACVAVLECAPQL